LLFDQKGCSRMTISASKFAANIILACLIAFAPATVQACWLTDWMWGNDAQPVPVGQPVITTNYPVYPQTVTANYPVYSQQVVAGYTPATAVPTGHQAIQIPTTIGYRPQAGYSSRYRHVPVTVYRPGAVVPTAAGLPVVSYQGCQTGQYQVQRIPNVTYRAVQPGCGCAPATYASPSPSVITRPPATGTQPAPASNWAPRVESAPATQQPATVPTQPPGQRFIVPQTNQPPATSNPASGSIYSTQPSQPADQRPALRPQIDDGPSLSDPSAMRYVPSTQVPTTSQPTNSPSITPSPITTQRPIGATVVPSASQPQTPWKVAPVTPIPDPEFTNQGSAGEAPQLLDPRDRTASLNRRAIVMPTSYLPVEPPQTQATPTSDFNSGWHSVAN